MQNRKVGAKGPILLRLRRRAARSLYVHTASGAGKLEIPMNIAIGADHGGFDLKNQLRDALIAAGVPASSLSIVYALRHGGGHAILAVNTDKGSFVLDNMTSAIRKLGATGYKLISMSGPNPLIWHRA